MKEKRSFFNLDVTLEQAVADLKARKPREIATLAGVGFEAKEKEGEGVLDVPFLGKIFKVHFPEVKVYDKSGAEASTYHAILILHYLAAARGTALSGEWISYRHLPGGDIYMDPFQKRAVLPFLKTFGPCPADFEKAAEALGAKKMDGSGVGRIITVLPRVPLAFVIWPGDEELPASANILFDGSAKDYLPTEDYAHLPAMVISELKKQL